MAVVTIDQVTTTVPTGAGAFDVLMRSIDSHLDKQYSLGRIKGSDYSTVYLSTLQTVLQQAIAFVLANQKTEKELALLDKQILLVEAQIALAQKQAETEAKNTILITAQAAKVNYETANILPKQALLIEQQELTETQQTRLVDANADAKEYEVTKLLPEQLIKIQEEVDNLQAQEAETLASTLRQNAVATEQVLASSANTTMKQAQNAAQIDLIERQTKGFDEDAQYKVYKSLIDLRTTGLTQEIAGIQDGFGNSLVSKMLNNTNLTGLGTAILASNTPS